MTERLSSQNQRIKALCEKKGIKFAPWEFPPPWEIDDHEEVPHPTLAGDTCWPRLVELRRKLKAELAGAGEA